MMSSKVHLNENMPCHTKKELFLANSDNKQNFINLLGLKLTAAGLKVYHAEEDADLMIVLQAIKQSLQQPTVVVAEDTDVLVLLFHHANSTSNGLFFQRSRRITSKKYGSCWNISLAKNIYSSFMLSWVVIPLQQYSELER